MDWCNFCSANRLRGPLTLTDVKFGKLGWYICSIRDGSEREQWKHQVESKKIIFSLEQNW